MYGTSFEHSVLYQYNFFRAANVLMAMIQTETPYYQPSVYTPFSSIPRTVSDPVFCTNDMRCNMSYAVQVTASEFVFTYGAGLYSFFYAWDQACDSSSGCQLQLNGIDDNSVNIYTFGMNTYGSVYMLTQTDAYSIATLNNDTFCASVIADFEHI